MGSWPADGDPIARDWISHIEAELRADPKNIAFTKAMEELAKEAKLPWWAFVRKMSQRIDREYIIKYAEIGGWEEAAKCAYGIGADPEQVRAIAALIYG